ncbi:MAG: hypothetical protein JWQ77_3004 [Jatrophihabitans sp.]|nr:hypothetical protein [Jatrophihabitans sp.]
MYGTEAVTYWAGHLSLPTLLHVTSHVDAVHGLYYLLMHLAFALGGGTIALRLPSVLGMTAAVVLTSVLARRLTGSDRTALLAGLALAVAPLASDYAQAGRSYAIDAAAALGTCLLLLRALDAGRTERRAWHWYTFGLVACAYLHEMTLLMIAAHGVMLVWSRVPSATFRRWLRAALWAIPGSALVIVASIVQSGQVSWIKPANWQTVRIFSTAFLGPGDPAQRLNLVLLAVAVLTALVRRGPGVTLVRFALPMLIVPPVLLIGESAVSTPLYGGVRYLLWCLPALAMLVAHGLDQLLRFARVGRLGVLVGVAVLATSLATQWPAEQRQHSTAGMPQDLLGEAAYISAHARPGDGIVFLPRSFYSAVLAYPRHFTEVRDLVLKHSPQASGSLYGTDKSRRAIVAAVDASPRVWLVGAPLPVSSTRAELTPLINDFTVVSRHHVQGVTITLLRRLAAP